jgi:hypothetical protein
MREFATIPERDNTRRSHHEQGTKSKRITMIGLWELAFVDLFWTEKMDCLYKSITHN